MTFPDSAIDAVFRAAVPRLFGIFGVDAIRNDETEVRVVASKSVDPVGEYGERAESRWTIEIEAATGAAVGDRYQVEGIVTDADPYPDPIVWVATQLIEDDGMTRKFYVRAEPA